MPRYLYKCESCGVHTEANHTITIKYEICSDISGEECTGSLTRIPSFSHYIKTVRRDKAEPIGKITQEAIEEATTELKEQKRQLIKNKRDHND